MWQDAVITIASIIFVYAMIPQIYFGFKKKIGVITYQFSILNTFAMTALTITYYSLNLTFSTVINFIITLLWITLIIQRIIYPIPK